MDCDLCGKMAMSKGVVEGALLTLCSDCAKHAQNVRPLPSAAKPGKKAVTSNTQSKEELLETVRPDMAKLLRQHREKLKLNHEQFAATLQIRASTYHHYESGTVVPDIATARKLEKVLGVPLVVHVRVGGDTMQGQQPGRGMTMGDFLKKS